MDEIIDDTEVENGSITTIMQGYSNQSMTLITPKA
jgi:hypothetical protein